MDKTAEIEKSSVALSSVFAAILLTTTKLIVGLISGSLGILSEAAHSAIDLLAAFITYFAVRNSGKPADSEHHYGHEKIENLSALIETELLLITCIWIIYEALRRLISGDIHIEVSPWAFGVVILSIIVDISRSRALMRAAKKHHSQALEADALHFRTDVWSSLIVLLGLILVWIGELTGSRHILEKADPLAALGVACIVLQVSYKLGRKCIDALLDTAPTGLAKEIRNAVNSVEGVKGCHHLRLRQSGKQSFVDLSIDVDKGLSVASSHLIAKQVEQKIMSILPYADVAVRADPSSRLDETLSRRIRSSAEAMGHKVHNIFVYQLDGQVAAELHLEVPEIEVISAAHEIAMELGKHLLREVQGLKAVDIHMEARSEENFELQDVTEKSEELEKRVQAIVRAIPGVLDCHAILVRQSSTGLFLSMHAIFPNDMQIRLVHARLSEAEHVLFREIPNLRRILIHPEPLEYSQH